MADHVYQPTIEGLASVLVDLGLDRDGNIIAWTMQRPSVTAQHPDPPPRLWPTVLHEDGMTLTLVGAGRWDIDITIRERT